MYSMVRSKYIHAKARLLDPLHTLQPSFCWQSKVGGRCLGKSHSAHVRCPFSSRSGRYGRYTPFIFYCGLTLGRCRLYQACVEGRAQQSVPVVPIVSGCASWANLQQSQFRRRPFHSHRISPHCDASGHDAPPAPAVVRVYSAWPADNHDVSLARDCGV